MDNIEVYGLHVINRNTCLSENNPHICIGWSKMGDLSNLKTIEEIKALYEVTWPESKEGKKRINIGQINRFVNETKIGDLIVFRKDNGIHIGKVISDYFWNKEDFGDDQDYKNSRKVKWLKHVSIDVFSQEFLNSLGAAMSYFSLTKYYDVVQAILDDKYLEELSFYKNLKSANDINPLEYDGSYSLVRKIIELYKNINENALDIKDLDLIYFATIGTWKSSFANKKDRINNSHLPNDKKEELIKLIDDLEKKTNSGFYKHKENDKNVMGMFGTGMGSLNVNIDNVKILIKLFIEIYNMNDAQRCINLLRQSIKGEIKGAKTGVISTVLHCLQPTIFPIFNNATFKSRLFEKLGILIENPNEITSYADNIIRIQEFRDKHFAFKNYRVFDLESYFMIEVKRLESFKDDAGIYTCNTNLSSQEWEKILNNESLTSDEIKKLLITWYNSKNHESSCKEIADSNGGTFSKYNALIMNYCKSICNYYNFVVDDDGENRYFPILMNGHMSVYNGSKVYNWILKDEVCKALESLGLVNNQKTEETIYKPYSVDDFLKEVFISKEKYEEIHELLLRKKNIILQGSPGVGKSFMANKIAYAFMGEENKNNIEMIQFHQSYSYEDFIYGYQPEGNEFKLVPGIFYSFCEKAKQNLDKSYFFIIDEINRGNLSKIFGELLMLIENNKRGDTYLTLSHTKEPFSVPKNLYIIGMMNTADRSLAIVDYALRRRFSFVKVEPAFATQQFKNHLKENGTSDEMINKIVDRFTKLNETIIKSSLGEDFAIGHSYFCDTDQPITEDIYKSIINYDIKPILYEYWFDNKNEAQQKVDDLLK